MGQSPPNQKRKLIDTVSVIDGSVAVEDSDIDESISSEKRAAPKRQRFVKSFDLSSLPTELLQTIFQECHPKSLGMLMQVCKCFKTILSSDERVRLLVMVDFRSGGLSESIIFRVSILLTKPSMGL
jgi:hypothetical protein